MNTTGKNTEPKQFDPQQVKSAALPLEVVVSDAAARHLLAQLSSQGKAFLRLGVKESGCNGYSYFLDWLDAPGVDDIPLHINADLDIHVAAADQALVHGTRVDYVREGLNATLQFKNANATGYCGCGESFSLAT
ncbi:MAG: iron-sulfur cluster assembly accessory protein [Gammaproteobacteria bacterium]|nr:iron-sulfur cluster assembly accessory protein [Gammaproteobacteria bacterium]